MRHVRTGLVFTGAILAVVCQTPRARIAAQCGPNPIVCENLQTGSPKTEWDITGGAGDSTLQGFATDISVNVGETVRFKVNTTAPSFNIDIYRMGYYNGLGARKVAAIPNVIGQIQPACLTDNTTRLVDCGNWAETASWTVPATAVSGIYFAKLSRSDTGGASHVVFVVRDDAGNSDLLFQTSDTTWQAYNAYGGFSLYTSPRATKVSYNRPFSTRGQSIGFGTSNWLFYGEYPMVRWLEMNGYSVSYWGGVDTDRRGSQLKYHKAFLSVGHDEYWSGPQRANVEAARAAGVHLAFFSGNEIAWKTRWEPSADGTATPYRTLVTYKETHSNAKVDPAGPTMWTGTWRDPRFSPPADGGRPENALTGQIYTVDRGSAAIQVPSAYSPLRFWKNTAIERLASGQSITLANQTLGYEWNEDLDNGFRPAGLMHLSSTTVAVPQHLVDFGSTVAPATPTHHLTLYRHASGALVFGAGTVQYAWGLDSHHDTGPDVGAALPDTNIQQATINLLADMGAQPGTLQLNMFPATQTTDIVPPASVVAFPLPGSSIAAGSSVTITGTAADKDGGVPAGVEVSTDGGSTWHRANGREDWSYSWKPAVLGATGLVSRAVDDSGNLETPVAVTPVTITQAVCPCSIWDDTVTPWNLDSNDASAVELGMRFRSDIDGTINGIRFHKSLGNSGVHTGSLWSNTGTLLATATFSSESASGWQQVMFDTPVAITAGVTYVASYHTPVGHYSADSFYFGRKGMDQWPLHALQTGVDGVTGIYAYGGGSFPNQTYLAANYWVDVVFIPADTTPPIVTAVTPSDAGVIITAELGKGVSTGTNATATFNEAMTAATINTTTFVLRNPANAVVPSAVVYNANGHVATLTPLGPLAASTTYTATVSGGSSGVKDVAGNALVADYAWSFTTGPSAACPCSIWSVSSVPAQIVNDPSAVELGVRFRADVEGSITGLRFYKSATDTGAHTGSLWSNTGDRLATASFSGESASGWQQVQFAAPVAIKADTTYVASYHSEAGNYAVNGLYFVASGVDAPPLHALATGVDGANGVYLYGASAFPTQTYNAANYWVDVVYENGEADGTPPAVSNVAPANGATGVTTASSVTATFSEAIDHASLTSGTFVLRDARNTIVPSAVTYNSSTNLAKLTPNLGLLSPSTTYTATIVGGTGGVRDAAGNALSANFVWSFMTGGGPSCPCSIWNPLAVPAQIAADSNAVELGVRFRSDSTGTISGIRFYKAATNGGPHTGSLWTNTGVLLATAPFNNESASGWQQVNFPAPVTITANTTYVASYHTVTGNYGLDPAYFKSAGVDMPPLHALANGVDGASGLYLYGPSGFPTLSYNATNYWVDVVFNLAGVDTTPPTVTTFTPANLAVGVSTGTTVTATFSETMDLATMTTGRFVLRDAASNPVPATLSYNAVTNVATLVPVTTLARSTTFTATISGGAGGVRDVAGNALVTNVVWSFTTGDGPTCPCSIWNSSATPLIVAADASAVELGLRFRTDVNGTVTGVRFYKSAANIGTHTGSLWSSTGKLLATATFGDESASGWQEVLFDTPVDIAADTTYIVSYHTNTGHYALNPAAFALAGVDSSPLHALANAVDGPNGVYRYGAGGFPADTFNASNYWVDVIFMPQ